ncbi:50S ribosomal protein L23 [Candidatus Saccharibacteria bacterium]|nr:MAG: 50S ribosomal protein L23 [Candidatus Saccharibacteria bacterium]
MNAQHMTLRPRISEKAYGLSVQRNVYVFDIPKDANKQTVAAAVEAQFKVSVTAVNIVNIDGKVKRTVRRNGRATMGRDVDVKKAYVTLKAGDSIPVFAAVEDDDQAKKAAKKEGK